jgi:putative SOS response-associated peptidase YedK
MRAYTLIAPDAALAAMHATSRIAGELAERWWRPRYNILAGQPAPIVRLRAAARIVELREWGLVLARRFGRRGTAGRNVKRIATVVIADALSPGLLETAIERRRCLVPATGYIATPADGSTSHADYRTPADGGIVAFAGVWSDEHHGGAIDARFAILVDATGAPAVIAAADHDAWLDPARPAADAIALLAPHAAWTTTAVAKRAARGDHDGPDCIAPVAPSGPRQGSLF